MRNRIGGSVRANRRGVALVAVMIMMAGLATLSMALLSISMSAANTQRRSKEEIGALYVAEAGLADALFSLEQGGNGDLGSAKERVDFGGASYWTDTTENEDGTLSIVSTGLDGQGGARVQLVVEPGSESLFRWGAFADEWLHLDAQVLVDSYDSSEGPYEDQAVNGTGSDQHANEVGTTGSNGDITLDQNAQVYGDSIPGVDGTITILGNADVTGSIAPREEPAEMPEIEVPDIASSGPLDVANNTNAFIGPGDFHYDRLRAGTGSTLNVYGPAKVIFDSFVMYSRAAITVHAENGPVEFFVHTDFILNSNTTIASTDYKPADVAFNLLGDNITDAQTDVDLDNLDFDSNARLYGTIYAPKALIRIDSDFELFGSLVARQIDLDSNCRVHFDEDLMKSGNGESAYTVICWRELPYRPGQHISESGD